MPLCCCIRFGFGSSGSDTRRLADGQFQVIAFSTSVCLVTFFFPVLNFGIV
jgi:hypothetical protein